MEIKGYEDFDLLSRRVLKDHFEVTMINKKMSIEEVVTKYPETVATFETFGLGCLGCQAALFESIEQGAEIHGIDVDALITDLNRQIKKD
jgi:hybrid cluster-associated redox disulfide protein